MFRHCTQGKPAVHGDQDLIVGHIALTVDSAKIEEIRVRLKQFGVPSRRNISVPGGEVGTDGIVSQAFVRDPDGYYVEICACGGLEEYLHAKG